MGSYYRGPREEQHELEDLLERDQNNSEITQKVIDVFLSNPDEELTKTRIAHESGSAHSAIYGSDQDFLPGKSRMQVLIDAGLVEQLDAEEFPRYRKDPYAIDDLSEYAEIKEYL
jgi:hypothetical protein